MLETKTLMHEATLAGNQIATAEQKRAALEAVLQSQTFARADQLKSFLRYVCEMELAGRGHELTEYSIAIEALGRPQNYSPSDDSAVRNRAFALRKKLQEFYEQEQPAATLHIELLKGSYCPHFVEVHTPPKNDGNGLLAINPARELIPLPLPPQEFIPAEANGTVRWKNWLAAFSAGALVTALLAGALYWLVWSRHLASTPHHSLSPILTEAWGSLVSANADVLMCVANPPSLSVHPVEAPLSQAQAADPSGRLLPAELHGWYRSRYPAPASPGLFMTITTNATYWGDTLGAMTALKMFSAATVTPHLFPEKVITIPTLRQRNVVLFGAPEYSPAVAHFLEKCPLRVKFLDAIVEAGQPAAPRYAIQRDQQNRLALVFGLITVLPSESARAQQQRTVIFSGVNSAGTQAAAEYFTSPEHLLELKRQLKKDGLETFPPAYQVVIRVETDDNILLNFRYETYRIINAPASP